MMKEAVPVILCFLSPARISYNKLAYVFRFLFLIFYVQKLFNPMYTRQC